MVRVSGLTHSGTLGSGSLPSPPRFQGASMSWHLLAPRPCAWLCVTPTAWTLRVLFARSSADGVWAVGRFGCREHPCMSFYLTVISSSFVRTPRNGTAVPWGFTFDFLRSSRPPPWPPRCCARPPAVLRGSGVSESSQHLGVTATPLGVGRGLPVLSDLPFPDDEQC